MPSKKRKTHKFGETRNTGASAVHTIPLQNTQPLISDNPGDVLPHRASSGCNSPKGQAAGFHLKRQANVQATLNPTGTLP
jgi:hypothetical protein